MMKLWCFATFFAAHWVGQFVSWSFCERNTVSRTIWLILSAPLFYISGPLADKYFWVVNVLNSAVWAAGLSFLFLKLISRHKV